MRLGAEAKKLNINSNREKRTVGKEKNRKFKKKTYKPQR